MINILNYLPPEANLSISLEQYQTFLEIAKQQERERIIKLLEGTDLLKTIESGAFVNYADTAIELIKGENK